MYRLLVMNLICLAMLINFSTARSETIDYEAPYVRGLEHYSLHQFVDAESEFSQSVGYNARIGRAFSSFQLDQLSKATALFKQSILLAKTDTERFLSLYNAAVCSFLLSDYESSYGLFVDAEKYNIGNLQALKYIKLSKYLAALVRAQLAREKAPVKKNKSSEGKRTISPVDFVFDEDVNLRIEDGESTDSNTLNQQQIYISDNALIKSLVDAGIASIKLSNNDNVAKAYSAIDKQKIYEFSDIEKVSTTPSSSTPDLWKRIFEIEQGYPASLEEAEVLPGVRPW